MAFPIQNWNPTLLAALASPNVPDYAGRISAMDLNAAQREKMLAEMAYLPMQRRTEALTAQAYLLQQGYMMGPDGTPVPTPAKAAELAVMQERLRRLGYPTGGPEQPSITPPPITPPQNTTDSTSIVVPSAANTPNSFTPFPQLTPITGKPSVSPNDSFIPRLNNMIDSGEPMGGPADQTAINLPYSAADRELGSMFPKVVGDPTDMNAANRVELDRVQNSPEYKGKVKMSEAASERAVKDLGTKQEKAELAVESLYGIEQAQDYLDSGVITGKGADFILQFGKGLNQLGIGNEDDPVANTEAFVVSRAKEVAKVITDFGSGTGLSDKDREYAEKIAAGTIALDEKSIRKILRDSEKANKRMIEVYNKKASKYSDVPEMVKEFGVIDVPKFKKKTEGAKPAPSNANTMTPEAYQKLPKGSQYTAPDGSVRIKR